MSAEDPGDGWLYHACARHAGAGAVYRCCECGEYLCASCVKIGSHLVFCGLCGERALELDELERPGGPVQSGLEPPQVEASGSQQAAAAPELFEPSALAGHRGTGQSRSRQTAARRDAEPRPMDAAAVATVNHVVAPAATIAMVSALLFFLLDVRSVFLGGTEALKWVGFWFVTGTVLIARYGRASQNAERQGCYTFALAAATLTVMTVAPWAGPAGDFAGTVANLLIVLVVWLFATRLTRGLSLEGSGVREPEARLYGVERLQMEQWQRDHSETSRRKRSPEGGLRGHPGAPAAGAPAAGAPVARLAAAGILAFALGEPFLLAGPPAAGERALGAMIVFLLAAGVVLAAASGLATVYRVRSLGGQASLAALPGRIASAGLVMVLLTSLALAMPGLEIRGTGALRPAVPGDGVEGGGETEDQGTAEEEAGEGRASEAEAEGDRSGDRQGEGQRRDSPPPRGFSKAASSLVGLLAELGRWLRVALVVLAALLALWGLWRLLADLGGARRQLTDGIRRFLRRLLAGVGGFFRRRRESRPASRPDPFADWQGLRRLEPREAVLDAYGRLLAAFELLEHPRPERHTPYEFLASIPPRLGAYAGPTRSLTELYVRVAYGGASAGDPDRRDAVMALEEVERLIAQEDLGPGDSPASRPSE